MKSTYLLTGSIIAIVILASCPSCKKFIEVGPPETQLITTTVFDHDETAIAAANAIYGTMAQIETFTFCSLPGLSADELDDYSFDGDQHEFATNTLSATNSNIKSSMWAVPYLHIYQANAILEGLTNNRRVSTAVVNQLTGEALFVRAFWNLYLVNMFGDVPILRHTDYVVNKLAARSPANEAYDSVIADLNAAAKLLSEDYLDSRMAASTDRIRPTRWAALSLLARAYLYTGQWAKADSSASAVIGSGLFSLETDPDRVFLKTSSEAIWQLMPVMSSYNTIEGNLFILTSRPSNVALSKSLMQAFEPGDLRRSHWTNFITDESDTFYYPFKYKIKSSPVNADYQEYSMVLRLAELYLIRAEARLKEDDNAGSREDLNLIRSRAGLLPITISSDEGLAAAIEQERRVELFTEWGHRWFDLARLHRADAALSSLKPEWKSSDTLYPIPQSEILANPNLSQNNGY